MPDGIVLLGFMAAALVVLLIPGPGVFYVVARSMSQGYRAGLISAMGLTTGALVHVAAATAGLSTILLTSATAFGIVKAIGATYLIFLGLRTLLGKASSIGVLKTRSHSTQRVFIDGMIISVFNPKIALFFLAFLPQFVDPAAGPIARQMLMLGLLYSGLALITDSGYALLSGKFRQWVKGPVMQGPTPRILTGSLYLGLGINTALTGRSD